MSVLVSIVVPVYNMEQYLGKCVDSLLKQSYSNIEVILVDDGSADDSPALCDSYASVDARVRVVHQINGGLSTARNAGIDVMQGQYVAFVDADDYLEVDAIKIMVETALKGDAKIVHIKSYIVGADYQILHSQSKNSYKQTVYSSSEYIAGMCKKEKSESVCDKLFAADLFLNRRFEKGRLNEDFLFLSKLLFEDCVIVEIDYAGYNYYQRSGSISHSGFGKSLVDAVINTCELKEYAKEAKPELERHFAYLTLFQARTALLIMPWIYVKEKRREYQQIMAAMKCCLPFISKSYLSKADKIFLKMTSKLPKMTLRLTSWLWSIKMKKRMGK